MFCTSPGWTVKVKVPSAAVALRGDVCPSQVTKTPVAAVVCHGVLVSPLAGSVGEYNWGGAGGTYFWVDPKEDMFVVFMMQSPKWRVPYRAVLKDMIYAAVTRPAAR